MSLFERNENFKGFLKHYPVTSVLVLINSILFLVMSIDGGSTNPYTLLKYGAYYKPLILEGEWYRFFTPNFLHIGFEHFLFNMFGLIIFAATLEKMIGSMRYLIVYIIAGLGGNVLVYIAGNDVISAGASCGLFGIFGAFLAIMLNKSHYLDANSKQIFLVMLGVNLIATFLISGISIEGHIGGLITGSIITYCVTWKK